MINEQIAKLFGTSDVIVHPLTDGLEVAYQKHPDHVVAHLIHAGDHTISKPLFTMPLHAYKTSEEHYALIPAGADVGMLFEQAAHKWADDHFPMLHDKLYQKLRSE